MRNGRERATEFQRIAREFENLGTYHGEEFTCIVVERLLGSKARDRYAAVFNLEWNRFSTTTAKALWSMTEDNQRDMRVLMLCFAAAMGL